jgi:hypothetical protein
MVAMAKRNQYAMRRPAESEPQFAHGGVMGTAADGTCEEGAGVAGRTGTALPGTTPPSSFCWGGGDGFALASGGEGSPAHQEQ